MNAETKSIQDENIELKGALVAAGQLLGNFLGMTDEVLALLHATANELRDIRPEMESQVQALADRWTHASEGLKAAVQFEKRVAPPASEAAH